MQSKEYAITPHKYELVCAEYKHSGGGPVATAEAAGPASMLGKQVKAELSRDAITCVCQCPEGCCAAVQTLLLKMHPPLHMRTYGV
jgi:hypothetical protein